MTAAKAKGNHSYSYSLREVFSNVAWPAAAGNVFWALVQVIVEAIEGLRTYFVDQPITDVASSNQYVAGDFAPWPRLALLLFFSVYLTLGWLRMRVRPERLRLRSWGAEFLHLTAIVGCAHAAANQSQLEYWLYFYFVVTTVSHFFNFWAVPGPDGAYRYRRQNIYLGFCNAVGIVVLWKGKSVDWLGDDWRLFFSYLLTFLIWTGLRWKDYGDEDPGIRRIESLLESEATGRKNADE